MFVLGQREGRFGEGAAAVAAAAAEEEVEVEVEPNEAQTRGGANEKPTSAWRATFGSQFENGAIRIINQNDTNTNQKVLAGAHQRPAVAPNRRHQPAASRRQAEPARVGRQNKRKPI